MKIFKVTTTTLFLIFSSNTFSQSAGSKTFPAEIWYCEVNDGFTMEDVRDVSMGVKKFSEENGMKGTQYLTTTPYTELLWQHYWHQRKLLEICAFD